MALKDLIASKASLEEGVIEGIVTEFARYDADHKAVVLTPEAQRLSVKARVLIYLVALQGWPYVVDDPVPVEAKPGEIAENTGIVGGTLRPILKELKDRNVILERGGRYSVRAASLQAIKAELGGSSSGSRSKRSMRKSKAGSDQTAARDQSTGEAGAKRARRSPSLHNLAERFNELISEGFFNKRKTLSEVQQKLHKEGIIVPQTSIPPYLLKHIRPPSPLLERDKEDVNGKSVWVYKKRH
jgi:hypothetical protein